MPWPAMSGAEPWTGSNIDGYSRSGFRLPEGAMPIEPATAAARSLRMSPNRFEATITSNRARVEDDHRGERVDQHLLALRAAGGRT